MTNIFIGGSRRIIHLAQSVQERLDNIIQRNFTVLVGDANGVDVQVQKYLLARHYNNVIIFCTGTVCRNNVGRWETRTVNTALGRKNFSFYAVKDLQMAQEATYGFMIWDGKSKGTLNNILNLLQLQKKVLVYFAPTQAFLSVKEEADLQSLLVLCNRQDVELFEKELPLHQFYQQMRPQFDFGTPETSSATNKVVVV
jgi:hypothetical protein